MNKLEKLNSDLFKPMSTSEAQVILGGAMTAGFTYVGRTQGSDQKIRNDYTED